MLTIGRKYKFSFPWLSNAQNDLIFFFAPVLLGCFLTGLFRQSALINSPFLLFLVLQGFALGPFHQGLTWFQFCDRENFRYYASRKNLVWAFIVPAMLIAATTLAYWFLPQSVIFVYVVWTIQHIAKQNIGVLLLYHNPDRNEAVVPRRIESGSVETASALFSFLFLNGLIVQSGWVAAFVHLLIALLSIELIWLSGQFFYSLWRQVRIEGKDLNVPALACWSISCLVFIPFAISKEYAQGLFVALIVHWFQYLGINAILVRRKYSSQAAKRMLVVNRPWLLFFAVGLLFAVVVMSVQSIVFMGIGTDNWILRLLTGLVFGMTLSHYFLDAFIWRFREPFNRAAILNFVKPNTLVNQRFATSSKTSAASSFI